MDIVTLIGYLITPVTGVVGWFAGSRQRKNTAIQSLQETIRMQSETLESYNKKIIDLMSEVQEVRKENAELKAGQQELLEQIESLKSENRELNDMVKAAGLAKPKTPRKTQK